MARGKVVDINGEPLIGATVRIKGAIDGVLTDIEGCFTITIPNDNTTLAISFIGFTSQEVLADTKSEVLVQLKEDAALLEEVVVVGYGVQRKESVVSSVGKIGGEKLRVPTRSLSNTLAGKIPGLISVQRTGEPGRDNAEFWIRGISSFAAVRIHWF